jgi:hypothetical protein
MDIETRPCFKINAPEFFEQEDFQEFLNRGVENDDTAPLATWHTGRTPNQSSDLFVSYNSREGSDALPDGGDESNRNLIPQDLWDRICAEMEDRDISFAVLWITNLGPAND